jgi:hypothetical protein
MECWREPKQVPVGSAGLVASSTLTRVLATRAKAGPIVRASLVHPASRYSSCNRRASRRHATARMSDIEPQSIRLAREFTGSFVKLFVSSTSEKQVCFGEGLEQRTKLALRCSSRTP